jgi:hypothetical protein
MRDLMLYAFFAGLISCNAAAAAPPDCTDFGNNDRMDAHDQRWCQALAFKKKYLEGGFVEDAPSDRGGQARDVHSELSTLFSSSGTSRVEGSVSIGELKGFFRLKLASTSNIFYYGREIRVSGTAATGKGALEIYSRVDVDLWKLAAVLVENSDRNTPPPEDGLILKGYLITRILPGSAQSFSAQLLPIGGQFLLLLNAPDGIVKDIRVVIDES